MKAWGMVTKGGCWSYGTYELRKCNTTFWNLKALQKTQPLGCEALDGDVLGWNIYVVMENQWLRCGGVDLYRM